MTRRHTVMPRLVALVTAVAFLAVSPAVGASPAEQSGNFPAHHRPARRVPPGGHRARAGHVILRRVPAERHDPAGRPSNRVGRGVRGRYAGSAAAGIAYEARHNRIWVAGGGPPLIGSGDLRVYDASSGALLATYQPPGVGLLNDVAVTRNAVYVTDSGFPQLVVIPLGPDGSLPPPSAATFLPVGGDMLQAPGINLNGIVAKNGVLLVANSTTGKLFRVDPATGIADKLDLGGADLSYPDGLELFGAQALRGPPLRQPGHPDLARSALTGRRRPRPPDRPEPRYPFDRDRGRRPIVGGQPPFHDPPEPTTRYWITQLPLRP